MAIIIKMFQLVLLLFGVIALYLGVAFGFSYFPSEQTCEDEKHKIFICCNEEMLSHSEIIMKIEPFKEDFFKAFPTLLHNNPDGYIAFSYGDRDFMMDEKGFEDLNMSLAFRGLFVNTPALIKVGHYGDFSKERCDEVMISTRCFANLKDSILKSFVKNEQGNIRYHDKFQRYYVYYYEAKNNYNLFHTCNTWTGDRLREAGVSMPYWTPLAENITSNLH